MRTFWENSWKFLAISACKFSRIPFLFFIFCSNLNWIRRKLNWLFEKYLNRIFETWISNVSPYRFSTHELIAKHVVKTFVSMKSSISSCRKLSNQKLVWINYNVIKLFDGKGLQSIRQTSTLIHKVFNMLTRRKRRVIKSTNLIYGDHQPRTIKLMEKMLNAYGESLVFINLESMA